MPKAWTEVMASPAYQGLPSEEQAVARQQYFDANVAPKVPEAEREAAWSQFESWKPPGNDVGAVKGLAREATQGMTFEFGDELGLGAAALAAKAAKMIGAAPDHGESVGEIYRSMKSEYDAERNQFRDEHPIASGAANIVGGVATGGGIGAGVVSRAAQFGKVATTGALVGTGAAEGALYGAGAADRDQRLEGAAQGAAVGAVVAPAAGAIVGGVQRVMAQRGARREVERLLPTRNGLRNEAHALYDQADQLGIALQPAKVTSMQKQLAALAQREGFNARIHPKIAAALDSFNDLANDIPTLGRIEQQRRILGAAGKSLEPDERRLAGELIGRYDDIIDKLKPIDVASGNALRAGPVLKQARAVWQRQAKLGVIDDAIERAQNSAGGFDEGLRSAFRSIANNPKRLRGFTQAERDAITKIVRGGAGENALRMLGEFGLGGNPTKTLLAAGGGYAASGGAGAVAAPVVGMMARAGAKRLAGRNLDELQKLSAAGAHPRYIVTRYAKAAGPRATAQELAQFLVTAPRQDLIELASKLNAMKGPNRKLAADALALTISGQAEGLGAR